MLDITVEPRTIDLKSNILSFYCDAFTLFLQKILDLHFVRNLIKINLVQITIILRHHVIIFLLSLN